MPIMNHSNKGNTPHFARKDKNAADLSANYWLYPPWAPLDIAMLTITNCQEVLMKIQVFLSAKDDSRLMHIRQQQ